MTIFPAAVPVDGSRSRSGSIHICIEMKAKSCSGPNDAHSRMRTGRGVTEGMRIMTLGQ